MTAAFLLLVAQDAIFERGKRLYEGTGYAEALSCFQAVLEREPARAEAHVWAALASLRTGAIERSTEYFQAARSAGLDLTAYRLEEARGWASLRKWEEAARAVDAFTERTPADAGALELKARIHVETGHAEPALPLLDRVIASDATRATTARLLKARALLNLKRFPEAREALAAVIREQKDSLWGREAQRRLREVDRGEQVARAEALKAKDPDLAEDERLYPSRQAVDDLLDTVDLVRRELGEAAVPMDALLRRLRDALEGGRSVEQAVARALGAGAVESLRGSAPARAFVAGQSGAAARLERSAERRGERPAVARARQTQRLLLSIEKALWSP